ncbi:MAG: hypothetical protein LBI13_05010 [Streptococcaceae bacterium]|jgi:cell division protein FtsL|nr:hypothetical protein [Streptococcaceae bacterium]
MADKKSLDISTALQRESFRIRTNTLSPLLRKRFSRLTHIERIFYFVVGITMLVLMSSIVFVRMKSYQIDQNTQAMQFDMSNNQTQIEQYNQNVNNLTSQGKVTATAIAVGLTQTPDNILKATK